MSNAVLTTAATSGKGFRIGLWAAQIAVGLVFAMAGVMKLTQPIPELAAMMKWPGDHAPAFVRFIGAVDLAGGLGVLLPSLTRILPRTTLLAALGCVVLQAVAIVFHISRGEINMLGLNVVLMALAAFVLWGRARKAPIAARASSASPAPSRSTC